MNRLIFSIAQSLLKARMRQTLVAAFGVTFSITMFVTLLGFMNGLNDLLDGLIINRTPHVRLYNEVLPSAKQPVDKDARYSGNYNFVQNVKPKNEQLDLRNSGAIMSALRKDKRVLGAAPKISAQVFFNVGEVDLTGVINGIDVEEENRLFAFDQYVTTGKYTDLENVPNSIILGKAAAEKMMTNIGDVVQITTSKGDRMQLKVVGFFSSGMTELDKTQSYASLSTTQKLLGVPNDYITDIQIKLHDITKAPVVSKEFHQTFETEAIDINTANAQFDTGSSVRSMISYAVGITLLIVAGFGIYNILNMMIYEKMDTIAILKATGFSGKDVNRVFIAIALSIGIIGGLVGLIFGFLVSFGIDNIPFDTPALPTIKTFPVSYNPKYYVIATVFSVITTYFAGYFPARKASRVDPVIIIRGK